MHFYKDNAYLQRAVDINSKLKLIPRIWLKLTQFLVHPCFMRCARFVQKMHKNCSLKEVHWIGLHWATSLSSAGIESKEAFTSKMMAYNFRTVLQYDPYQVHVTSPEFETGARRWKDNATSPGHIMPPVVYRAFKEPHNDTSRLPSSMQIWSRYQLIEVIGGWK